MPVRTPTDFRPEMLRERFGTEASNSAAFSGDAASVAVPYIIDLEEFPQNRDSWFLLDIVAATLGTAYCEGTRLRRILPFRHPQYSSCYARRITGMRGIGPREGDTLKAGYAETTLYGGSQLNAGWMGFKKYELTIEYENIPWRVVGDEAEEVEYARNTLLEIAPTVEQITIAAGNMAWAENSDGGGTEAGDPFQSDYSVIIPAQTLTLKWLDVPADFISPDSGYSFPKLQNTQGCVNSDTFLGRAPGTLLLKTVELVRKVSPLFEVVSGYYRPVVLYDVTFVMSYFDPPKGNALSAFRGHNLVPTRRGVATDGVVYLLATRDGTTSGPKLYRERSFASLFTHHTL